MLNQVWALASTLDRRCFHQGDQQSSSALLGALGARHYRGHRGFGRKQDPAKLVLAASFRVGNRIRAVRVSVRTCS